MRELFQSVYYGLDLAIGFGAPVVTYLLYRTGRISAYLWRLFWIGCAGSFDLRAIKVTRAFVEIMRAAGFTEEAMWNFHRQFEKMEPDAHEEFLQSLGIEAGETVNCEWVFRTLLGIDEGRLWLEWISAAEGQKFAAVMAASMASRSGRKASSVGTMRAVPPWLLV